MYICWHFSSFLHLIYFLRYSCVMFLLSAQLWPWNNPLCMENKSFFLCCPLFVSNLENNPEHIYILIHVEPLLKLLLQERQCLVDGRSATLDLTKVIYWLFWMDAIKFWRIPTEWSLYWLHKFPDISSSPTTCIRFYFFKFFLWNVS